MRARKLKVNPKTNFKKLEYTRNRHREGIYLFESKRDIEGFLTNIKNKLIERKSNINQLQKELNLNKKTIYRWFDKSKQPSQAFQKLICEHLDIPYYPLALNPNENGEYPCGLRICSSCDAEFAVFRNTNYGRYWCEKCRNKNTPL